jgi:hypothetical protein
MAGIARPTVFSHRIVTVTAIATSLKSSHPNPYKPGYRHQLLITGLEV